jgi:hypothetical protein
MYVYDISPYKISMPRFSGLLVITIKSETNCTFHTASMLFYIVHKICLNRSCTFLKMCYHAPLQYLYFKLSGPSVTSPSDSCVDHAVIADCRKLKFHESGPVAQS